MHLYQTKYGLNLPCHCPVERALGENGIALRSPPSARPGFTRRFFRRDTLVRRSAQNHHFESGLREKLLLIAARVTVESCKMCNSVMHGICLSLWLRSQMAKLDLLKKKLLIS